MTVSIVVLANGGEASRRAVAVGGSLGVASESPVELLCVLPCGADLDVADEELDRLVPDADPAKWRKTVVFANDVVGAIVDELAARPAALVVLGTHARGPIGELLLGSVSENVLARSGHPVLLVGPHVDATQPLGPALVAAVNGGATPSLLVPSVIDWSRRFGVEPWFVHVDAPVTASDLPRSMEGTTVHRVAEQLRAQGVDAQWDVLHGRDTGEALIEFTATMGGGVVVVASERWADPHRLHWTSTARSLVHRSPFPVLVVPVHHALVTP